MKSRLLIAAAHSGAGKTTLTLGLLRALQNRGTIVQPFKCGPDYLDPQHHLAAAGKASINLDRYMMSDAHIRRLYRDYGDPADVCIAEGVMGLFDGADKMEGSSADIARLLQLPVILVLNAKAMAYSAAAILYGLKNFCQEIQVAGVLFNFVERESHYRLLLQACEDVGVEALGYLPTNPAIAIASRHLGLDSSSNERMQATIAAAALHIEKYVAIDRLLEVTQVKPAMLASDAGERQEKNGETELRRAGRRVLVARDAAFNFIYPANIRALEQWGSLRYFSPLSDERLPPADLVYLPGGYPELHLEQLSANRTMIGDLQAHYAGGGKILAECGGMMYLGEQITDETGKAFPMCGILPLSTGIQEKKLSLGYRTLRWGDPGRCIRGHEFHYSRLTDATGYSDKLEVAGTRGERLDARIWQHPHLFASYMHLYWGEEPGLIDALFS